jgi:RNase P subunit RPR2
MSVKQIVCESCDKELVLTAEGEKTWRTEKDDLYEYHTCDDCWQEQYEQYTYNRYLDERGL